MHNRILLLLGTLVGLVACSSAATTPQATHIPFTSMPDNNASPPPNLTRTLPTLPTLTPTLAQRQPENLTTAELHERLDPFAGGDCVLPCYGGLVAGQSNTQNAIDFYARLGIGTRDLIPGDYPEVEDRTGRMGAYLSKTSDIMQAMEAGFKPPLVDIYIENDVVQYIYVGWQYSYPSYLTVPRVLEIMGQPDRLDLGLVFSREPVTFVIQLVYTEERLGFSYYGNALGDAAQQRVCLTDDQVVLTYFGLVASGSEPMEGLADSDYLLPLLETLTMSYNDFTAQITAGGCLEILASQWAPWQGIQTEVDTDN